ncbi:MAG: nitronate monooxygenase [Bacteroidales bacterium]|nr:nitronate monooxygenase [Bacteroidales bacterium]
MNELKIGNLTVKVPIIQGGMGVCVSLSGLASAVANEGGIGVISAVGIGMTEPDFRKNLREANKRALKKEIRKARLKTNGILGVNIMLAASDFDDLLEVALKERIDVVFIGAGLPLKKPSNIKTSLLEYTNTKFIPKVSSARTAKLIFRHWSEKYDRIPDAIVIEGPLSGGHQGFRKEDLNNPEISLSTIVRNTIHEIDFFEQKYGIEIPVIAAGGIYSGKDIFDIMSVGAKGVKMGTRFVTTNECDASIEFKQNYLSCSPNDITIIDSPVGLPGRVITNNFVQEIQTGKKKPINCPWKCLKICDYRKVQFCIAEALFNAATGNFRNGFSFAGTKAFLAKEIISVKETINQLKNEYLREQLRFELILI